MASSSWRLDAAALAFVMGVFGSIDAATAQVHKCQGADGKTVYSDAPCAAGKASVIDARPNSVDTSALREAGVAAQQRDAVAALRANPPAQCRFKAFKYGDKQGQVLREAATTECLQNAIAAQRGEPPTLTAYQRWADHYRETAADRRAAAAEISAAERARQSEATTKQGLKRIEDQIDNKKYTCRKDSLSLDVICK